MSVAAFSRITRAALLKRTRLPEDLKRYKPVPAAEACSLSWPAGSPAFPMIRGRQSDNWRWLAPGRFQPRVQTEPDPFPSKVGKGDVARQRWPAKQSPPRRFPE